MSKPKKQKESGNERFLRDVGNAQIGAAQTFEPAHQAILREARADHTERFRGRLSGDVWQGLGGSLSAPALAGGDARRAVPYEGIASQGLGAALREGTVRGTELKDGIIDAGANSRLANAKASGRSLQEAARTEAAVAGNKIRAANEVNNSLISGVTTVAAAGVGEFMNGRRAAKDGIGLDSAVDLDNQSWLYKRGWSSGMGNGM